MKIEIDYNKEFDDIKAKAIKELKEGKDILIKVTPLGLKTQSMKVKTL